jgi:hypothetical protein
MNWKATALADFDAWRAPREAAWARTAEPFKDFEPLQYELRTEGVEAVMMRGSSQVIYARKDVPSPDGEGWGPGLILYDGVAKTEKVVVCFPLPGTLPDSPVQQRGLNVFGR